MTSIKSVVEFGKMYRDTITGLEGIATGIVKHQFGCVRIALQPKVKGDGTVPGASWIDEESLEGVCPVKTALGGPMPAPKRAVDPSY